MSLQPGRFAKHAQEDAEPTDAAKARQLLQEAIDLHVAHINGTEPTSESSQNRLADLMQRALDALPG